MSLSLRDRIRIRQGLPPLAEPTPIRPVSPFPADQRLKDAEAVCQQLGRLIELRQSGAQSHVQNAASSQLVILWERWQRRWNTD